MSVWTQTGNAKLARSIASDTDNFMAFMQVTNRSALLRRDELRFVRVRQIESPSTPKSFTKVTSRRSDAGPG